MFVYSFACACIYNKVDELDFVRKKTCMIVRSVYVIISDK